MNDELPELPCSTRVRSLEIQFHGSGALVREGQSDWGGVVAPELGGEVDLHLWREVPDEDGLLNPVPGEPTVEGAFQLSLEGTAAGFRALARYLLAVAELDVRADPGFHEHHEVTSGDGRTRLHVIVRRRPEPPVT